MCNTNKLNNQWITHPVCAQNYMRRFTRQELIITISILIFLVIISVPNFNLALRRARDAQRRNDTRAISEVLIAYKDDLGYVPPANEKGEILACMSDENKGKVLNETLKLDEYLSLLVPCRWGVDPLADLSSEDGKVYMPTLPRDPKFEEGTSYRYISTLMHFQILAYFEGEMDEDQYKAEVVTRNINCGNKICNFGFASEKTPLDKSLEEYENEIEELGDSN